MPWGKNATKKKTIGFGELNLDEENVDSEDKRRQEDTSDAKTKLPELGIRTRVRVKDIIDPKSDRVFDEDHVLDLAERLKVEDQIYPILVRMVKVGRGMVRPQRTILVDGAHRLRAKQCIKDEYIDCMYIQGDNIEVELTEIGANFTRKQTVLARSENLVRWMLLALAKLNLSGQLDRQRKIGPSGGIKMAATRLPLVGRSVDARRKIISRAAKIEGISPEGKEAARKAHLDDNQLALLEIAKAGNPRAQVRKAKQLAARWQGPESHPPSNKPGKTSEEVESPPTQPHSDETQDDEENDHQDENDRQDDDDEEQEKADGLADDNEKIDVATPPRPQTTLDALLAMWDREGRELWAYAPSDVRLRFIERLRQARRKAKADVATFVRAAFQGREMVSCEELYGLAKARSLSKATVRKALKEMSYPRKRKGYGHAGIWFYRNVNPDWKDELPAILALEFKVVNEIEEGKSSVRSSPGDSDYYNL